MLYIKHESQMEIDKRLHIVISECEFKFHDGTFMFEEFPLENFTLKARSDALALVRDTDIWSQLIPSSDDSQELFALFSFHFTKSSNNSGFVGWLANHLKQKLGTGVFVVCGQNSKRGGIFDYWGCPAELGSKAVKVIHQLMDNKQFN